MQFGAHIRALRKAKGLSQRTLAAQLGLDYTYVSRIETGRSPDHLPSAATIRRLAAALDADPDTLLDLAGKFDADVLRQTVEQVPELGAVLRRIQPGHFTSQQAQAMMRIVAGT